MRCIALRSVARFSANSPSHSTQALKGAANRRFSQERISRRVVGSGRYRSLRHMMPFHSRIEGLDCVSGVDDVAGNICQARPHFTPCCALLRAVLGEAFEGGC